MPSRTLAAALPLSGVVMLLLAGCGDDGVGAKPEPPTETPALTRFKQQL